MKNPDDIVVDKLKEQWGVKSEQWPTYPAVAFPALTSIPVEVVADNHYLQGMLVTIAAAIQTESLIIDPDFGSWLLEEIDKKMKRHRELMK